jgi:predicted Fe-Mo cluster-binding NifX family protein
MKIALPTNGTEVDSHFGHCEFFTVITTNDRKEIVSEELIQSPAGCGCKSNIVQVLSQMGVKIMLAGNMGEGAVNVLNSHGIEVIRGCAGDVKTVAQRWIDGDLADSQQTCHEHRHGCHQE